jgi:hypothetical protein
LAQFIPWGPASIQVNSPHPILLVLEQLLKLVLIFHLILNRLLWQESLNLHQLIPVCLD